MQFQQIYLQIKHVLTQQIDLLHALQPTEYLQPHQLLSNHSIGAHTRHIIELFQCLLNGYNVECVNYDQRKRETTIETNLNVAIENLQFIIENTNRPNKKMYLQSNDSLPDDVIASSYYRELYYNIEHCIHHQALIKVALLQYTHIVIPIHYGVAPATIQHQQHVYS